MRQVSVGKSVRKDFLDFITLSYISVSARVSNCTTG